MTMPVTKPWIPYGTNVSGGESLLAIWIVSNSRLGTGFVVSRASAPKYYRVFAEAQVKVM